ncbi:MAG: hypothetical protein PVJ27_04385 [Candidatus Brocadiaceae bacterium]|jgi:hypothetical protein
MTERENPEVEQDLKRLGEIPVDRELAERADVMFAQLLQEHPGSKAAAEGGRQEDDLLGTLVPALVGLAAVVALAVGVWRLVRPAAETVPPDGSGGRVAVREPTPWPEDLPSYAAYRAALCRSPEELDSLLERHGEALLPTDGSELTMRAGHLHATEDST